MEQNGMEFGEIVTEEGGKRNVFRSHSFRICNDEILILKLKSKWLSRRQLSVDLRFCSA